jgi:hypothetical protein
MNGQAKDGPVIFLNELFEGCDIALLRGPNQSCVVNAAGTGFWRRWHRGQNLKTI